MITHSHPHFNACCSFADWVSRASMLMYVMRANQRAPSSKSNFWWTRERWWRWRPTIRSTSGPFKRRFRPSCIVWSFKEKGKSLKRLGGHAPGLVMRKLISPFFFFLSFHKLFTPPALSRTASHTFIFRWAANGSMWAPKRATFTSFTRSRLR